MATEDRLTGVSVVIPAQNAAETLAETIESLLAQTDRRWEAVVVDDGSTDRTWAIAEHYSRMDSRIHIIHQEHRGVGEARNAGIGSSQLDWIYFLDSDDWIMPDTFERLLEAADGIASCGALHFGWAQVIPGALPADDEFCPISGDLFSLLAKRCAFPIHACLVRRSCVELIGGFDPSFKVCEDWDFWQRLARSGVRFDAMRVSLARYRVRPESASSDALRFLADGFRVLDTGHASDPRVTHPVPEHRDGSHRSELFHARIRLLCWIAGNMRVASGEDARPLLDLLEPDARSHVDARAIAHNLYEGVYLAPSRRITPVNDRMETQMEARLDEFLPALERHLVSPGLEERVRAILERRILHDRLSAAPHVPETRGKTHAVSIELTHPLSPLTFAPHIERLVCHLQCGGETLGVLHLPACDGFMSRAALADAVAAEFAWPLLGRFFEETLAGQIDLRTEEDGLSVWRDRLPLARKLLFSGRPHYRDLHDTIGFTLFLQEVWDRPHWPPAAFYDPLYEDDTVSLPRQVGDHRTVVDIADDAPELETDGNPFVLEVHAAGVPLGLMVLQAEERRMSAQRVRAAVTTWTGFELVRAVVREALLGAPLDGSLRSRLHLRRVSRLEETAGAMWDRGEQRVILPDDHQLNPGWESAIERGISPGALGIVVGRRAHGWIGSSASRYAVLPWRARAALIEAARVAGEPVVALGHCTDTVFENPAAYPDPASPVDDVGSVAYIPELQSRPINLSSPPCQTCTEGATDAGTEGRGVSESIPAASAYDRHYFEALFASGEDPWRYTSAYEQRKYEQTLSLLPPKHLQSALEVGCAEGHFTIQLAPRVEHLIAADVSEVALKRTADRSAHLPNVETIRLDLARDPIPGHYDLIVCSEVLYYMGEGDCLDRVGRKLADAIRPGGFLLLAHANVQADDPESPGFDWDVPFGAKRIGETLARIPSLHRVRELRTPYYRIHLFRRRVTGFPSILNRRRAEDRRIVVEVENAPPNAPVAARFRRDRRGEDPVTRGSGVGTDRLPILMYHHVAPEGPASASRHNVSPDAFERQLRYLRETGYHGIAIDEWVDAMRNHRSLPGRGVLLTFDDGYQSFEDHAWPLLRRYGFPAMVFLVADRIGGTNAWDRVLGEELPLLGWASIHRLQAEGVRFGSHSMTHPMLTALSPEDVVREASLSRASLQRNLGAPIASFAYPYGDGEDDPGVRYLIGASGYTTAFSCHPSPARFADPPLALPRIEITGWDELPDFIRKLGL